MIDPRLNLQVGWILCIDRLVSITFVSVIHVSISLHIHSRSLHIDPSSTQWSMLSALSLDRFLLIDRYERDRYEIAYEHLLLFVSITYTYLRIDPKCLGEAYDFVSIKSASIQVLPPSYRSKLWSIRSMPTCPAVSIQSMRITSIWNLSIRSTQSISSWSIRVGFPWTLIHPYLEHTNSVWHEIWNVASPSPIYRSQSISPWFEFDPILMISIIALFSIDQSWYLSFLVNLLISRPCPKDGVTVCIK